jgi:hypothetical protein
MVRVVAMAAIVLAIAGSAAFADAVASATFSLAHQSVDDATALVLPLLGPDGNLRIHRGTNSLEVRDVPSRLSAVRARLAAFDHPPRALRVQVELFRAGAGGDGTALSPPTALEQRLRQLFRFAAYRLVASGDVLTREGESVKFQAAGGYEVAFHPTAVMPDGRLVLDHFSLWRRGGPRGDRPLLRSQLRLVVGRPLVIGLTRTEGDQQALFLALTCRREEGSAAEQ